MAAVRRALEADDRSAVHGRTGWPAPKRPDEVDDQVPRLTNSPRARRFRKITRDIACDGMLHRFRCITAHAFDHNELAASRLLLSHGV